MSARVCPGRAELRLAEPGLLEPSLATVGDYLELMKPRVMSLVVFTALAGWRLPRARCIR